MFLKGTHKSCRKYETPFSNYKFFCESIINKVEELEKTFLEAHALISRIESMGVSLNRNVLIEKYKK